MMMKFVMAAKWCPVLSVRSHPLGQAMLRTTAWANTGLPYSPCISASGSVSLQVEWSRRDGEGGVGIRGP